MKGVCIYDLTNLFQFLIFDLKLFLLDTLNARIQCFNYNETEIANKPPYISSDNLKTKLRLSSSKMLCLTRYLGLMIGDLSPDGLEVWKLWIKLR